LVTGFGLNQSASSIEFTLTGSSKIELNGSWSNRNNDVYFTVYINGVRQDKRVRFTYLDRSAVIADGLNYKNTYTIKLVRETEEKYGEFIARSLNIGYLGRMLEAPREEGLYIEFLGDSITCGLGSLCGYLSDDGLNVSDTDGGTPKLRVFRGINLDHEIWDGTVAASFAGGTGSESDPYLITNAAELAYLASISTLENASENGNKYFKLTNDIYLNDVSDVNWYSGTNLNSWILKNFHGTLDGDGHIIHGIYITEATSETDGRTTKWAGFVDEIGQNASIKNLGIEDSYIAVSTTDSNAKAGALVGRTIEWTTVKSIENCYASDTVHLTGYTVGGLIGMAYATNYIEITNCYSSAVLTGTTKGGIIGTAPYEATNNTLENCYSSTADVELLGGSFPFRPKFINCYATKGTNGDQGNVTALTVAQMTGEAAYENMTGFDFNSVWHVFDGRTCGIESAETSLCEDATNSYAYLAAQTLNADCNFISYSGIGIYDGYGSFQMGEYFEQHKSTKNPDLVVINLGTNDYFKNYDNKSFNFEAYENAVKDLINKVRTAYGTNTKIIWATGLMNDAGNPFMTAIENVITGLNDSNLYYFGELTKSSGGHNGHPTKVGAEIAAQQLVDYIVDNKILTDKENALAMPTDSQGEPILSSDYRLTWYDGFSSSSLDLSQWNQTLGTSTKSQKVVGGLGDNLYFNQESGCSDMVMSTTNEGNGQYNSPGDVTTLNRMAYKYGYLEIRAKVPYGRPVFPAFWMRSNRTIDKDNAAAYMTEVDIFEVMASDKISPNIHKWTDGYTDSEQAASEGAPLGTLGDSQIKTVSDNKYHTYGFMITPERVGFYFDGECYAEVSAEDPWWKDIRSGTNNPNKGLDDYFFIILTQQIFTEDSPWKAYDGCEVQPGDNFPINFAIDYIRLYQDDQGKIFYGELPK